MGAPVTRVFLVFFRQQPESTFERCSFDFLIPRRHDVNGNFLLRWLNVLTLQCPFDVRDGRKALDTHALRAY